jgi:hypothetical protein
MLVYGSLSKIACLKDLCYLQDALEHQYYIYNQCLHATAV